MNITKRHLFCLFLLLSVSSLWGMKNISEYYHVKFDMPTYFANFTSAQRAAHNLKMFLHEQQESNFAVNFYFKKNQDGSDVEFVAFIEDHKDRFECVYEKSEAVICGTSNGFIGNKSNDKQTDDLKQKNALQQIGDQPEQVTSFFESSGALVGKVFHKALFLLETVGFESWMKNKCIPSKDDNILSEKAWKDVTIFRKAGYGFANWHGPSLAFWAAIAGSVLKGISYYRNTYQTANVTREAKNGTRFDEIQLKARAKVKE